MSELYLVGTPIGNLEDITYRAVRILNEVDFIIAEDTRHTRKLLTHFDIHKELIRYDENNKLEVGSKIIERIKAGEKCACVSDAGMPAISDPGADLVKLAIESAIKVVPIPGANAALSALISSGLDTNGFTFIGFLPKKKVVEELKRISAYKETLIIYESPHRLKSTLKILNEVLGNRKAVIARELTKVYEEFLRGDFETLIEIYEEKEPRGEFVIVIEGANEDKKINAIEKLNLKDIYEKYLSEGLDKKSAMRETAKRLNISRREVYNQLLNEE